MQKYINFVLLSIAFCMTSPVQAETLLELYQLAVENDPQLKIAHKDYLATLEKRPQARALLLPYLGLGADVSQNWSNNDGMFGGSEENTRGGYNLSLTYPLYKRDLRVQVEQVDSQIKQVEANYESAKQALMERLSTRYFGVLAANDNVKFARSAKGAFQRQLDDAKQRFEVGLIAITDVQEAQAGYDLAVADEIQAQNELDNAIEALREITGSYHSLLASLNQDAPLLGPNPKDIETWTEYALENNPQVLAVQYAIETASKEIEKQRAGNWPTVEVVGKHSYSDVFRGDDSPFGNRNRSNSIALQLSYPLYEGGAIRSRTREAKQRYYQALDQKEQQRRAVQLQTRQAFLNVLSNISRVKALKQALVSTETALKAIQAGFELGTRTSVDVVNAQRDLLRAQRNYSNARYNYVLNTLRLKQAAGLISVDDLAKINNWLSQHTIELQDQNAIDINAPLEEREPLPSTEALLKATQALGVDEAFEDSEEDEDFEEDFDASEDLDASEDMEDLDTSENLSERTTKALKELEASKKLPRTTEALEDLDTSDALPEGLDDPFEDSEDSKELEELLKTTEEILKDF
jgi:outer membrane protein